MSLRKLLFGVGHAPTPTPTLWRRHWFFPKEDITAFELALLMANTLGIHEIATSGVYFPADRDVAAYLGEQYGLPDMARHFERTDAVIEGPDL